MYLLFNIFINVILPVFGIVLLGYFVGGWLDLESKTLTRLAYYFFVPAFIFQSISGSEISFDHVSKIIFFIIFAHLITALIAASIGLLMGRSKEIIAAFIMISVFGNVGNYGLAVVKFRFGAPAILPATIYYLTLSITAFIICVSVIGWSRGGSRGAIGLLLKTPALWPIVPAIFISQNNLVVPEMLSETINLLAKGMIPVMLFSLGLQLKEQKYIYFSSDVALASLFRLLLAPFMAYLIAIPFKLDKVDFASGVLQAGMPAAILVAIIAKEHNLVPHFIISVVLFSTLGSLVTLTLISGIF